MITFLLGHLTVALALYQQSALHQACEDIDDMRLCPIRIGFGKSRISAIGNQVMEGSRAAWDSPHDGWCGLSHDVLEIDLGRPYDLRMIKVKSVLSSPAPESIRLEYFDHNLGTGDYERFIDSNGKDNIKADELGTVLVPQKGKPLVSDKVRVFMILPDGMKSSTKACMKMEIYYREPDGEQTRDFFNKKGLELNFGIMTINDAEQSMWWQFPFDLKNRERISSAEVTFKVAPMSIKTLPPDDNEIEVEMSMRSPATQSKRITKKFHTTAIYVEKLDFGTEVNTNLVELFFLVANKNTHVEANAYYRILIQKVVLHASLDKELVFRFDGRIHRAPDDPSAWLKMARISPTTFHSKKREAILVEPRDRARKYLTLAMRCKIDWMRKGPRDTTPTQFTSTYATGYNIFASDFTNTLNWQRLRTSQRDDSFWVATVPNPVNGKLAFYFDNEHSIVKISNIIGFEDRWTATDQLIPDTGDRAITPDVSESTSTTEPTEKQLSSTATGIVVGIVAAIVVVVFVTAILFCRRNKRNLSQHHYTSGTGPIYRDPTRQTHTPLLGQHEQRPNGLYSLPDNIPKAHRVPRHQTMPNYPPGFVSPTGPKPHQPRRSNPPQNQRRNQRPQLAPPQAPEPIYEPPINFRENSPRLYGPIGTIRYAQPDALKSKRDPPVVKAELIKVLEPLGSGEFGEVLLVEAPISAFPENAIDVDLPKGAKDCLAALKRLKEDCSKETKDTFLAEAKLMYGLRHPNILPLLAVIPEVPALLTGYSEHGDLRQFLRRRLTCEKTSPDDPGFISNSSLLDIVIQIASAMEYLESMRVVHRDLAARNCFVGRGLKVRVGDFGMSRNLYCSDYFKVTGNAVLPIRWSAWESIILGKFTTKSDVWAFAVTCCETFTLCRERPLENMTDEQVIHRMVSLYKEQSTLTKIPWLPKPDICPEGIWEIIMNCWIRDADSRPSFKKLHHQLLEEKNENQITQVSTSVHI